MTGPEHYRTAVNLLVNLSNLERGNPAEVSMLAEAQVHATLAVAAALAGLDAHEGPGGGSATGRTSVDATAWEPLIEPAQVTP